MTGAQSLIADFVHKLCGQPLGPISLRNDLWRSSWRVCIGWTFLTVDAPRRSVFRGTRVAGTILVYRCHSCLHKFELGLAFYGWSRCGDREIVCSSGREDIAVVETTLSAKECWKLSYRGRIVDSDAAVAFVSSCALSRRNVYWKSSILGSFSLCALQGSPSLIRLGAQSEC